MVAIIDISGKVWPLSFLRPARRVDVYSKRDSEIIAIASQYARTLGEEVRISSARAPMQGRALFYGGHMIGWIGLLLAGYGLLGIAGTDPLHLIFGPFGLGAALTIVSGPLVRRGRRLLQPSAAELHVIDKRRPVVLLRSFRKTDAEIVGNAGADTTEPPCTIEDVIGPSFQQIGPLVAIGAPDDEIPRPGAVRAAFGEAAWSAITARIMDQAVILVAIPGHGAALDGEIAAVASRRHAHKLLVLFPPRHGAWPWQSDRRGSHAGAETELERSQPWLGLRTALGKIPEFAALPEVPPPRLMAAHLSSAGETVLITGPRKPTAADYQRAIAFAVYGMKCHRKW